MRRWRRRNEEKYGLPTLPVLTVLLPPSEGTEIPDRYETEFLGKRALQEYVVVRLWEVDVSVVFETPLPTLLPFVPLMRGGANVMMVRRALGELRANADLADLEPVLGMLAGYVMDPKVVQQIVRWDMAAIRDNPFVEELKQIWLQEGRQRDMLEALEVRFGKVPAPVRDAVNRVDDESRLNDLFRRAVTCGSVEEFATDLGSQTG